MGRSPRDPSRREGRVSPGPAARLALVALALLGPGPACGSKCKGGKPPEEACNPEVGHQSRCGDCADGTWSCHYSVYDEVGEWVWNPEDACECIGDDGTIDRDKCPQETY